MRTLLHTSSVCNALPLALPWRRYHDTTVVPSPFSLDRKSLVVPVETLTKRLAQHGVPAVVTSASETGQSLCVSSAPAGARTVVGTSLSCLLCGTATAVRHGALAGAPAMDVLQFVLTTQGYRQRQAGEQKLFQNEFLVRARGPWSAFSIPEGSRVVVRGALALHVTYDMVSKSNYENPVVDVGCAGYLGLLVVPAATNSAKKPQV